MAGGHVAGASLVIGGSMRPHLILLVVFYGAVFAYASSGEGAPGLQVALAATLFAWVALFAPAMRLLGRPHVAIAWAYLALVTYVDLGEVPGWVAFAVGLVLLAVAVRGEL